MDSRAWVWFGFGALAGCGGAPVEVHEVIESDLRMEIASPGDGAGGVSVTSPALVARINRPLERPERLKVELVEGAASLFGDAVPYQGVVEYSATNLEIVYRPFNILRGGREYTLTLRAEGAEASVSFSTEAPFAGVPASLGDRTFDLRLRSLTYPAELAEVFNAQLDNAPPVLLHVVGYELDPKEDGRASLLAASSTGRPGDPMGRSAVPAEDAVRPTTTAVALSGAVEGTWLGAGPFDLRLTASGVPLAIRELFVTGIVSAAGDAIDRVTLTGVIDPRELGEALELDLGFICEEDPFRKYCDEDRKLRVAAEVDAARNEAMPFTAFVTSPVNAASGVAADAEIEVLFSEPIDRESTRVRLRLDGSEVEGTVDARDRSATLVPSSPLRAGATYTIEVEGVSSAGRTDSRHTRFTTR